MYASPGHILRLLLVLARGLGQLLRTLDGGRTWQDYATGAPITAQMTAGKIDIGSMGDFPLLINAARGKQLGRPTHLVSVTGYNLRGGLNTIVTAPGSKLTSLKDLKGKKVSTSVGSAPSAFSKRSTASKYRFLNTQTVASSACSLGFNAAGFTSAACRRPHRGLI